MSRARVVWPLSGAVDVPIDAPVVVELARGDTTEPAVWQYDLVSRADGMETPLETVGTLDGTMLCDGQFVFLEPVEPLAADTEYRVRLNDASDPDAGSAPSADDDAGVPPDGSVAFVTGTSTRLTDVQVGGVQRDDVLPSGCAAGRCTVHTEVFVDTLARGDEPVWLELSNGLGPAAPDRSVLVLSNDWEPDTIALSVDLPAGDACAELRVIDVTGADAASRSLCEPERCARSDERCWSSCGGYCAPQPEPWDTIDATSCAELPPLPLPGAPNDAFTGETVDPPQGDAAAAATEESGEVDAGAVAPGSATVPASAESQASCRCALGRRSRGGGAALLVVAGEVVLGRRRETR
jgi:hypothetical protein